MLAVAFKHSLTFFLSKREAGFSFVVQTIMVAELPHQKMMTSTNLNSLKDARRKKSLLESGSTLLLRLNVYHVGVM